MVGAAEWRNTAADTRPEATVYYAISVDGRLAGSTILGSAESSLEYLRFGLRARGLLRFCWIPATRGSNGASSVRFSPDNRAAVYSVLRKPRQDAAVSAARRVGPALCFFDPTQEVISDFGWSPSGKQLALVRQKSSSDVVLIKDLQEKGKD